MEWVQSASERNPLYRPGPEKFLDITVGVSFSLPLPRPPRTVLESDKIPLAGAYLLQHPRRRHGKALVQRGEPSWLNSSPVPSRHTHL
jgi:hypothetical protein